MILNIEEFMTPSVKKPLYFFLFKKIASSTPLNKRKNPHLDRLCRRFRPLVAKTGRGDDAALSELQPLHLEEEVTGHNLLAEQRLRVLFSLALLVTLGERGDADEIGGRQGEGVDESEWEK